MPLFLLVPVSCRYGRVGAGAGAGAGRTPSPKQITPYFISPKKLASRRFYTLCEASAKLSILGPLLTPGQISAKAQAWLRVSLIQPGTDHKDMEKQRDGQWLGR